MSGEDGTSNAVVATTDGGARWHEEAVPATPSGVLLTDISCPSISRCWAAGPSGLKATRDGGATWQQLDSDYFDAVSCSSMSHCVAMGFLSGWELVGAGLRYRFVTSSAPPFAPSSSELDCPSATVCIAAGATGGAPFRAAAFISTDGGRSWSELSLQSLVATSGSFEAPATDNFPWPQLLGDTPDYSAISCQSADHCVVLGSGAVTEVATTR